MASRTRRSAGRRRIDHNAVSPILVSAALSLALRFLTELLITGVTLRNLRRRRRRRALRVVSRCKLPLVTDRIVVSRPLRIARSRHVAIGLVRSHEMPRRFVAHAVNGLPHQEVHAEWVAARRERGCKRQGTSGTENATPLAQLRLPSNGRPLPRARAAPSNSAADRRHRGARRGEAVSTRLRATMARQKLAAGKTNG
jgi:hypothetical protein